MRIGFDHICGFLVEQMVFRSSAGAMFEGYVNGFELVCRFFSSAHLRRVFLFSFNLCIIDLGSCIESLL